jgi:response regulator NasT
MLLNPIPFLHHSPGILSSSANPTSSLVGLRVLVVEDEGITQMQLRRILNLAGLQIVGSVANGRDAVEMALAERPALILMDINMPVMDGLEAAKRILEVYSSCIVMLTAYPDIDFQQIAQQYGAMGYVLKPIDSHFLLPELERIYRSYQQARPTPNP